MNRFMVECRAEITGDRLAGHAAVFGQVAVMPGHYERLAPSAFRSTLGAGDDVAALINHNPSLILGRTSAGTLRLDVDERGLAFSVDLPDTSYARDLRQSVARGDIKGMSFGFMPGDDEWSTTPDGRRLRTHTDVKRLLDVSAVTYPAYEGTDVTLRHLTFTAPAVDARTRLFLARHRARITRRSAQ